MILHCSAQTHSCLWKAYGRDKLLEDGADETEVGLLEEAGRGSRRHGAHVHHVHLAPARRGIDDTGAGGGEQSNDDEADQRNPHDRQ